MSTHSELRALSLNAIRFRCAEESERFFSRQKHDPRYCFEMFRRAVLNRDELAWECVYTQYLPLVKGWVERHSLFPAVDEESQYFVNWAFEKMWVVLSPEKFHRFPDLKSILRYLQMCVHSALVDYMRAREQAALLTDEVGEDTELENPDDIPVEEQVFSRSQAESLWSMLDSRLKNEKERRVVYGSFVLALKPGDLLIQFPYVFQDVNEIYLIKENILARLRRDGELREFLNSF